MLRGGTRKTFQCNACHHQTSLIARTLFEATKLGLTVRFLAIYLIGEAKTGLSALALKRDLGVSYPTAWLSHHKLMQAMVEREAATVLFGTVQVDDAYLGGELVNGAAGRDSENKVSFVGAVSLNDQGHPLRAKFTSLSGFPTVVGTRKPRDLPMFRWVNTVLGNLKTSFNGAYHSFDFSKYAARYLGAIAFRFNRRFDLRTLPTRLLVAATACGPRPESWIRRVADVPC
ncbi:ISXO2 transposase-like protein [Thiocapsa rosea]|uniref:ISXO2 transposase-like protein n=1 Tax=Thiocapsa rosea TaxID=69360 RepID=A0A495V3W0_9GAMM|nr:ISXO2 transposase-like protein [Thiocapsa rosea]